MRKIAIISWILVLFISVATFAQLPVEYDKWKQIDDNSKFLFMEFDSEYETKKTFAGFYIKPNVDLVYSNPDKALEQINDWWLNRRVLVLYVRANQQSYFFPTDITFTQGNSQYDVGYGDMAQTTESFSSTELRKGILAKGYVAVPKGIETDKPYKIWYGDYNAIIG